MDGAKHYTATLADPAKLPRGGIESMTINPSATEAPMLGTSANLRCGAEPDELAITAALHDARKPGTPEFVGYSGHAVFHRAPAYLVKAPPQKFAAAVRRALAEEHGPGLDDTPSLDTVFVIPASFGKANEAVAESGRAAGSNPDLRKLAENALVKALQFDAVRRAAPQLHDPAILDASAVVQGHDPESGSARHGAMDSIVPIASPSSCSSSR